MKLSLSHKATSPLPSFNIISGSGFCNIEKKINLLSNQYVQSVVAIMVDNPENIYQTVVHCYLNYGLPH